MKVTAYAAALLGAATLFASPAQADLLGQSVTATFSGSSAASSVVQFASPQTIGAGVEFTGSFVDAFDGPWQLALDLDATGFTLSIDNQIGAGNLGNIFDVDTLRIELSGLTGLIPITLASYSCATPGVFPCTALGVGPSIRGTGSDANSAFVALGVIRRGETYRFTIANAVPEPASWAMMIAGFGLAGAAMRRRPARALAA